MVEKQQDKVAVVAAVVLRGDKLFLARRSMGTLAGHWEFPGGKVERGETQVQALEREIQEELGVGLAVGEFLGDSVHVSVNGPILISFFLCDFLGEPQRGVAHDALAWVVLADVLNYRLVPADVPIVKRLQEENRAK